MGDSITEGVSVSLSETYPAFLAQALQFQASPVTSYDVVNFGKGWTTVGPPLPSFPPLVQAYPSTLQFSSVLSWHPNIAVITLGTNDARGTWDNARSAAFEAHYAALIAQLKTLSPPPRILLGIPPPFYNPWMKKNLNATKLNPGTINQQVINELLPNVIRKIAGDNGLSPAIDLSSLFANHCPDFSRCDWMDYGGLHPNAQGNFEIAKVIKVAINVDMKLANIR